MSIILSAVNRFHPVVDRIEDRLLAELGDNTVFTADKLIQPGDDYMDAIQAGVEKADAVLVVMDSNWLATIQATDDNNYDKIAIEAALQGKGTVIPVLLDGATMPTTDELPEALASLGRRRGVNIGTASFRNDVVSLIDVLKPKAQATPPTPPVAPVAPVAPASPPAAQRPPATPPVQPSAAATPAQSSSQIVNIIVGALVLGGLALAIGFFVLPFSSYSEDSITDAVTSWRNDNTGDFNELFGSDASANAVVRSAGWDALDGCTYTGLDVATRGDGSSECSADATGDGDDEIDYSAGTTFMEYSLFLYVVGGGLIALFGFQMFQAKALSPQLLQRALVIGLFLLVFTFIWEPIYTSFLTDDVLSLFEDSIGNEFADVFTDLTVAVAGSSFPTLWYIVLPLIVVVGAGGGLYWVNQQR